MGKVPARLAGEGFLDMVLAYSGVPSPSTYTSTKDMAGCPAICYIKLYGWRGGG